MATLWNKTLFYLGLVDEEPSETGSFESEVGEVTQVPLQQGAAVPLPGQGVGSPQATIPRPSGGVAGRRVEPPSSTRQRISNDSSHAEAGVYLHPTAEPAGRGRGVARRTNPESHIIVAKNFSDAQALADAIRMGRGVVLDLRNTEPEMVRRIVDFTSGLTYALDGKMVKTAQGVILVTPQGLSLGVNEQERLSKLGLFDPQV